MNQSSCQCWLQVVLEQEPHSQAAASHQLPVAIHASLELLDRQVDILARKLLQVISLNMHETSQLHCG